LETRFSVLFLQKRGQSASSGRLVKRRAGKRYGAMRGVVAELPRLPKREGNRPYLVRGLTLTFGDEAVLKPEWLVTAMDTAMSRTI
jgi:hypothetical protein